MGAETAYGASGTHMRVGKYLWNTIQAHRLMTEFQEAYFHRHTSMAPSVFNHLFYHRAEKFDVDVIKTKKW